MIDSKEEIEALSKRNNGYVTSRQVKEMGIPTVALTRMVESGQLVKLARGIYLADGYEEDRLYTYSLRYDGAVFSGRTALYLNGLLNDIITVPEMTFPIDYDMRRVKDVECRKAQERVLDVGVIEIKTPYGNIVRSYDKEASIREMYWRDLCNEKEIREVEYSYRVYTGGINVE